jgi:hypothetical protein
MKRSLSKERDSQEIEPPLGASEFAATLNGDNPQAILSVLKRFARTVRKERRVALGGVDDEGNNDSDDESSSGEDEEEEKKEGELESEDPETKKYKKTEEWKEDTRSYNVPFVGTSVAKGDWGKVVKGEWPTGLLKAYLQKSPIAVELTSDDLIPPEGLHKSLLRKKKGKMSRIIYKFYLKALAELVTAAIPIPKLQSEFFGIGTKVESTDAVGDNRFLLTILKNRVPDLCDLLKEETDKGRGKLGVFGGCGPLAAVALKNLEYIACTSVPNARLVARHLDEELSDGVLRVMLRPLPPRKESKDDDQEQLPQSKYARLGALSLARVLVQAQDGAVATYICAAGNRERKVKPGILYLALREGLATTGSSMEEADDDYLDTVKDLLEALRLHVLDQSRIISRKTLGDLLSRDALQNLCQFSAHAPQLSDSDSFHDILSSNDSYQELTSLEGSGVEARRLLSPLLADSRRSPFLHLIGRDDHSSSVDQQQLIRALIQIFHVPRGGRDSRRFIIHCLRSTPPLLPALFKVMAFPETKSVYGFISHLNFVSSLIREGPSPFDCLSGPIEPSVDEALLTLFPLKLKKQPLSKALQIGNSLVVLECLKFMLAAIERFRLFCREGTHQRKWTDEYVETLSGAFLQWLPDLQIVLSLRSRLDPFSHNNKANALVNECLFRVLGSYASVLPSSVREIKFDWMKLLPVTAAIFFKAAVLVQERVLSSLELIMQVREVSA